MSFVSVRVVAVLVTAKLMDLVRVRLILQQ